MDDLTKYLTELCWTHVGEHRQWEGQLLPMTDSAGIVRGMRVMGFCQLRQQRTR